MKLNHLRRYLLIMIIFTNIIIAQEDLSVFTELSKIEFRDNVKSEKIVLNYNPTNSEVINKQVKDEHFEIRGYITRLVITKIDSLSSDKYLIDYDPGISADPMFCITKIFPDTIKYYPCIDGLIISIPGNGYIYISGHTDNMFDQKKIYKIEDNKLVEVQQPYYYVGMETETNIRMDLFSDRSMRNKVVSLEKGAKITVLINTDNYYLIATQFGIVGWFDYRTHYRDNPIKGIYFAGD